MKIELWYDAVATETDIRINGYPVEKNDAFGFLYPVRNYPVQSWLYPIGSWKGLEHQIENLSPDEKVDLVFYGRECDYVDIEKCLSKSPKINLSFYKWDSCKKYNDLLSNLYNTLNNNCTTLKNLCLALQLENASPTCEVTADSSSGWMYRIFNDIDFAKAENEQNKCCYFIHESFFTDYNKAEMLLQLTRSLKIPADAIYCCFDNEQLKENYQYYAKTCKRMFFNFCLGDSHKEAAFIKYGEPFVIRNKIKNCIEQSKIIASEYLKAKSLTDERFEKLTISIDSLNDKEKECYEKIRQLRFNADIFTMGLKKISDYTDVLFSLSKADKNEALHYECIDRLEEIINLYLIIK